MPYLRFGYLMICLCLIAMSPVVQAQDSQPLPDDREVISAENVDRLEELMIVGRGSLNHATFSPDGSKLILGTTAGVWFYDFNNLNSEPLYINPGVGYVSDVQLDKTGAYLQVRSYYPDVGGYTTSIWFIGQSIAKPQLFASNTSYTLTPDGRFLVQDDNALWDPITQKTVAIQFPDDATFSPDVTSVATLNNDRLLAVRELVTYPTKSKEVRLFDTETERYVASLKLDEMNAELNQIIISHDSRYLIASVTQITPALEMSVRIWPIDRLLQLRKMGMDDGAVIWQEKGHAIEVEGLFATRDGVFIENVSLTPESTRSIDFVRLSTQKIEDRIDHQFALVHPITGDIITLTSEYSDQWQINNYSREEQLGTLPDFGSTPTMQFSPDEAQVITVTRRVDSHGIAAFVRLGNTTDWQSSKTLYLDDLHEIQVRFQPDGRPIAVTVSRYASEMDKQIDIWDISSGKKLQSFSFDSIPGIRLSDSGQFLLVTKGSERWLYDISDPESSKQLPLLPAALGGFVAQFSPDSRSMAIIEFQDHQTLLRLWLLEPLKEVAQIRNRTIILNGFAEIIQWIDGGQTLVLCEAGGAGILNYQTTFWKLEHLFRYAFSGPFMSVPDTMLCRLDAVDRGYVAIPTYGKGVQVWLTIISDIAKVVGEDDPEWWRSAAFSPDGWVVFGGSYFGKLTAWDHRNGTELATFAVTPWHIEKIKFIRNGSVMVIHTNDGTIRLWGVPSRDG